MDCSAAAIGLLLLIVAPLALAALLRSRATAAALARLEREVARLRELLEPTSKECRDWRQVEPRPVTSRPAEAARAVAAAGPAPAAGPAQAANAAAVAAPPAAAPAPVLPLRAAEAGEPAALAPPLPVPPPGEVPRAAARTTFEELIGARLLLWVGAAALALAGAFLVKISFERGWISPPVRVAMGVAFGVALLALAEALRRSSGRIAEALAAAGIADLFACFLAAVHLYRLVPPAAGFLLMALTTAVAVALALRHGAMVALIGMAGGFLTPALIQTGQPSARNLFGYLLLLTAGLLAVAGRRRWPWLAVAALAAGLLWAAAWLGGPFQGGDASWLSLFLIALAAGATLPPVAGAARRATGATVPPVAGTEGNAAGSVRVPPVAGAAGGAMAGAAPGKTASLAAVAVALALLAGTVARSGFSAAEWGFLYLLAAGVIALGWLDARYLPLAWAAAGATAAVLGAWGRQLEPAENGRFLLTALAGGGLFAVTGWAAALYGPLRRQRPPPRPEWPERPEERHAADRQEVPARAETAEAATGAGTQNGLGAGHRPGRWASLSAAAGVGFFLVAWGSAHDPAASAAGLGSETWGGLALAAAALYLAAAVPVARRRRGPAAGGATAPASQSESGLPDVPSFAGTPAADLTPALAALAVAITSLVSLAVPLALGRDSFAAAWALEAAALVWLAGRFCLPALIVLARLLGLAAVGGALFSGAAAQARYELPLWNELLYAYGVPLLALAGAAWMARRPSPLARRAGRALASPGRLATELEWEAVVVGFALLTLEIDQLFPPAAGVAGASAYTPFARGGLAEWAALTATWLALGWAMLRANARTALASLELAGRLVILLGLGAALAGSGAYANPLWSHQAVGSKPLLDLLAAAYALPAALAVAAAAEVRRHGGRRLPRLAGATALLLGFTWISLEVRHLFHGTWLDSGPAAAAERYAYSAAWVLYGVALLLAGIARRGPILRYGSLAVMLLAALKVFLYDTARLSDVYRVLSFLGLGASLLLLAFLYQRFVFREVRG